MINCISLFRSLSFCQLDSKAQKELKEDMKMYESDPGLKNSWDNVQKMVSIFTEQHMKIE